ARGLVFALGGLLPVLQLLPLRPDVEGARFLDFPAVGIALALASLAAGCAHLSPRGRWLVVLAFAATLFDVGRANFAAWRAAGAAVRERVAAITPLVRDAPRDARILAYGLPDSFDGALCLRNAMPAAARVSTGRRDLTVLPAFYAYGKEGALDSIVEGDHLSDLRSGDRLAAGESARIDLARCAVFDGVRATAPDGALRVETRSTFGSLLIPPLETAAGSRLRVHVDGSNRVAGAEAAIPLVVTCRRAERLQRDLVPFGQPIRLPADASVALVEILVAPEAVLDVRSIEVTVEP
ncbi:MAG TPA: hypothetical protein VKE69_14365, partial [Planctomycetota bacterium]|nr:hypothetical protein [Planctomycetota bacterium]